MTGKIALLFPGQGSQYVGMGRDLADAFPEAKRIFDLADDICPMPVSRLCFDGPMDELTLTVNLQPAVTAMNLACLAVLKHSGVHPAVTAGHSLGEYSALNASKVITDADALLLVKKRGELMHRESLENPGVMAAVLGMDIDSVGKVVEKAREDDALGIANHNTADQIVITGEKDPISRALKLIKEQGGKAIPLKVSGAWHSSLMKNAVHDFRRFMDDIPFSPPETPILFNSTAETEDDPQKIRDTMSEQLVSPVRWHDIMLRMLDQGIDTFLEVGPKKVLTGLLKKTVSPENQVGIYNVEDMSTLNLFLEAMA